MGIAVAPPPDVLLWLRGSGLEILLLVLGAILLTRFATWLGGVITARIDAEAAGERRPRPLGGGQAPARPDPGAHLGGAGRRLLRRPPC